MVHETPAEFAPLAQAALGHRASLSKGSGHLPEPCREEMDGPALMRLEVLLDRKHPCGPVQERWDC